MFALLLGICFLLSGTSSQNCTQVGRFPYVNTNCQSYYVCGERNGVFIKSDYVCPTTTTFNPLTQKCSLTYRCTDQLCVNAPGSMFIYYDPNTTDCTTFIRCVLENGVLVPRVFKCNPGFIFVHNNPLQCVDASTATCVLL